MIDASVVRYPKKVLELADSIWQGWGHPKVYVPRHCYYIVHRKNAQTVHDAVRRLSYLAKVDSKSQNPRYTRDYSASRIAPKPKT